MRRRQTEKGRADGHAPLRRLLDRRVAEALLASASAAAAGGALALVETDGSVFVGVADELAPFAGAIRRSLASGTGETTSIAEGLSLHPLSAHGDISGGLLVRRPVTEPVVEMLRMTLAALLAQAVDLRVLGAETLDRYREINLLYRVGESIGASLDAAEIPGLLLAEASKAITSNAAAVLIGARRLLGAGLGRPADIEALLGVTRSLVDAMMAGEEALPAVPASDGSGTIGALLGVPIKGRDERIGVVVLGRRAGSAEFTAGDQKLLLAVAGEAGVAYDRARLHEQEVGRERLDEELAVGRRMQRSLLPASTPDLPGWEFATVYQPAREVGGDFYDFVEPRDSPGSLDLVIGDVTGKGVPAALLMAFTRAVLRASADTSSAPSDVLRRANRHILRDSRSGLFVTALYATLDVRSGDLVFASGGHDAPLLVGGSGHRTRLLTTRSSILGAFPELDLEDRRVRLAVGDLLVLYTDGVTEARDARRRLFGERRLRSVVAAHAAVGATAVVAAVHRAVLDFTGDIPLADDLTLLVVKRTGH